MAKWATKKNFALDDYFDPDDGFDIAAQWDGRRATKKLTQGKDERPQLRPRT